MNQELMKPSYRGVLCQCCRQPIPLPTIVLDIESSRDQSESGLRPDQGSRVFSLRCRACDKEMPYGMANVVDIEGSPKLRISRVHGRPVRQHGDLSRAANA